MFSLSSSFPVPTHVASEFLPTQGVNLDENFNLFWAQDIHLKKYTWSQKDSESFFGGTFFLSISMTDRNWVITDPLAQQILLSST